METVEILTGAEFTNAVRDLGLTSAICEYHHHPPKDSYREEYQVWRLSKEDFDNICGVNDKDWKDDWGWWRWAKGSNVNLEIGVFIVNGHEISAWECDERSNFEDDECAFCNEYYLNHEDPDDPEHCAAMPLCFATQFDKDTCGRPRVFSDIFAYLCDEIGASTEKNVCACLVDLAAINGMSMSDLLKKYLG